MFWLGLLGRKKIGALEDRMVLLEEDRERMRQVVRENELQVTDAIDRLVGIAKRIQGRKGGRPPQLDPESDEDLTHGDPELLYRLRRRRTNGAP